MIKLHVFVFQVLICTSFACATPLHDAVREGDLDRCKALIDLNGEIPDINVGDGHQGWTPLVYAIRGGHESIARWLLDHGATATIPDGFDNTPLHFVAAVSPSLVKQMIELGANVNAKNQNGDTPLDSIITRGSLAVIRVLLDHGAVVNGSRVTTMSSEILHRNDRIKLLLDRGVDVNAENVYGLTLLQDAAKDGYIDIARILLSNGADVNYKDDYQGLAVPSLHTACRSPLHMAAMNGHHDMVDLLINYGARPEATDVYGSTALQLAIDHGHMEVVRLLRKMESSQQIYFEETVTPALRAVVDEMLNIHRDDGAQAQKRKPWICPASMK